MEITHRFLPERKNRGNKMSELAKNEAKMLDDDKYEIFKEDSNDDDFNPDDLKKADFNSSSDFENEEEEDEEGEEGEDEEGEENEDDVEESKEEKSEKIKKKEKKEKKKTEEILDIDQLDIDKIDMIEDLRDKGIDIDDADEEELERRMREYNEESEYEEEEKINKKKFGKKKKDIKKKGRKKKLENVDDNIFLDNPNQETNSNQIQQEENDNNNKNNNAEFCNGKIIISNPEFEDNNMELEEENQNYQNKSQIEEESEYDKSSKKSKKSRKEKNKIKININPETDEVNLYNSNISIDENMNITINKNCLTENLFPKNNSNLEYIEINKNAAKNLIIGKTRKGKIIEKKSKPDNKNIISINYHSIVINKNIDKEFMQKEEPKEKPRINNKVIDDEISINNNINNSNINNNNITNELIGHKRTRYVNNLIELFKKQKKAKINKNVTIIGNRDNPKYIHISKKIYDENDEEKELQKEEKKKKKKEKDKTKDEENEEANEIISFDLEQETDTKNIIKKYKQKEKDKKQFGLQNKVISQEQRLLESIFTELTNKQSLKTMQKLEDLNKKEYTSTSRKILKDTIRIINSQRHIIEAEKEKTNSKNEDKVIDNKNDNSSKKQVIEVKITDIKKNEIKNEEKIKEENDKNENKENKENIEKEMDIEENKKDEKNEIKEEIAKDEDKEMKKEEELKAQKEKEKEEAHKKLMEEYKQREKKLNKITVTFTNKDYFRSIFATMNKKPTKDKKEKICIITGKPAKYFDPLTKNYYSTIEAFKILRERYFQKEEDCLLFKIQTLSDLASQKKERLKKMIMQESENNKTQTEFGINNSNTSLGLNKRSSNAIRIDSETMTVEDPEETGDKMGVNSTLLKMINKFGLLRKDAGVEEKKTINHRIYNRNRENCVESGMLLEANKFKLIISKKIFKDKYSSKLPSTTEVNNTNNNSNVTINSNNEN